MVIRRLFGRKKEDETEEKEVTEATTPETSEVEQSVEDELTEPEQEAEQLEAEHVEAAREESEQEAEEPPAARFRHEDVIPYHDSFVERLKYLFESPPISTTIEGPDEFRLEFMAMGERFWIRKDTNGPLTFGTGAVQDEDVFIRVSNEVVKELLDAPTFEEFSRIYMHYYRNAEAGKYVRIELRKSITDLNHRGYARVPLLKLLVGAAR